MWSHSDEEEMTITTSDTPQMQPNKPVKRKPAKKRAVKKKVKRSKKKK